MSNRKEIKYKNELQAKFQYAISQSNSKVASWVITPQKTTTSESADYANAFLNLPVIRQGSGLGSANNDDADEESTIGTIGDFVNGTKNLSTMTKKQKMKSQVDDKLARINNRHRVSKDDSKVIQSLKNKMRNDDRRRFRQENLEKQNSQRNQNDASDSSDEEQISRSVKKGSNLLIEAKMGKRKGK